MKNFPSLLAVIGAWLCAAGFVLAGVLAFILSSMVSILVQGATDRYTVLFFAANVVAFFRLVN
jgi:hypothetical protein